MSSVKPGLSNSRNSMNILYLGDIVGEPGMRAIEGWLPEFKQARNVDVVVAQLENLTDGKGIAPTDFERMRAAGVDIGTGGNWSLHNPAAHPLLDDAAVALVRPANYPAGTPGLPYKYHDGILVISLMGQIVGRDANVPMDNPLQVVDTILAQEADTPKRATVVNLHGDFSSEKFVIGHYLDGRASIAVGDHWHVPTNDAEVLPGGTAHQTDVGMCGSLDSCIGVRFDIIEQRWLTGKPSRNELETIGRLQINGLLTEVDELGRATRTETIRQII